MKIVYSFLVVMTMATGSFAQTQEEISNYLDFFNNQHQAVNQLTMSYLQYAVHSDDFAFVEQKRQELIAQLNKSIAALKELKSSNMDDSMQKAALEVYENYLNSFEADFSELLQLKMNSQSSYEAMEKYFEARKLAEQKVDQASNRYNEAFKAFAQKYNIQLMEAEENSAISSLNQLNNYQQTIFLKYYKVVTLNNQFMDALNGQNIAAAKTSQTELLQATEQTLKSLRAMPPFKEDSSYRDAAIKFIELIKSLSKEGYTKMIQMLEKPDTQRTQEDVNQYNNVITQLQEQLPQLDQAVQMASSELLKKFVPKPDTRPAKRL